MSRPFFDHPIRPGRKSVVREARSRGRGLVAQGEENFLKKYQNYLLIGAGALIIAIVYQVYSRRLGKKKDEEQIQRGLQGLDAMGAQAAGTARAPLQVDPAVIEILQQQVLDYQAQVEQLEQALIQRDMQLEQIRLGPSGGGGPGGAAGIMHPAANGNFAGLHGQMDPNNQNFSPLPSQMQQPVATRDPQAQSMGAFSNDPGLDTLNSAEAIQLNQGSGGIGGMGGMGAMGGSASQFTPL